MRITFLVDNLPHPTLPLLTEHGLSLYIETDDLTNRLIGESTNRKIGILCDMGASGAYIKNAKALGIDLKTCHWAFLSHGHADHTGGLGKWVAQYGHIPVYASHYIPTLQCFSSRPKRVASHKSQVESQCKVSAEASLLDYAEPQPDFMSEANKVASQRFNDSAIQHSRSEFNSPHHQRTDEYEVRIITASPERSELRYIGTDLNLFKGATPWFKPIEQNTWISPGIALVHPTCQQYSKPLGNKYLTAVASLMHISEESTKRLNDSTTKQQNTNSPNHRITASPEQSEIDPFLHEIALCFVTPKGLVIVSCCSHHGALNTIASCMEFTGCNTLHAYIGGLHFVDSPEVEAETTSFINDWLRLYPNAHLYTGHCTCPRAATLLKAHIPHCHTFYTGNVIEV